MMYKQEIGFEQRHSPVTVIKQTLCQRPSETRNYMNGIDYLLVEQAIFDIGASSISVN
jgi:hypothetical protein